MSLFVVFLKVLAIGKFSITFRTSLHGKYCYTIRKFLSAKQYDEFENNVTEKLPENDEFLKLNFYLSELTNQSLIRTRSNSNYNNKTGFFLNNLGTLYVVNKFV